MAESIVQDWLAEYESLQPEEISAFINMHENNQEIADAIYTIFNERLKYPKVWLISFEVKLKEKYKILISAYTWNMPTISKFL